MYDSDFLPEETMKYYSCSVGANLDQKKLPGVNNVHAFFGVKTFSNKTLQLT